MFWRRSKTADITTILIDLLINILIWVVAVAPALWLAGRWLAGRHNAKFTDALWIVVLGAVIFYFVGFAIEELFAGIFGASLIASILSFIVLLVIWLALVKHFFDCGWLKALAISIVAVIIAIVFWFIIGLILALIGFATGWFPDPTMLSV